MKKALSSLLVLMLVFCSAAFPLQGAALDTTSSDIAADHLALHYEYLGQFIPALSQLYGSALDSFVDITLTNSGQESITVLVQSWIEDISEPVEDTRSIAAGESLTVMQNPKVIPEAVDELDEHQEGTLRVRVIEKAETGDVVLHDESVKITVHSRRDFVWQDGLGALANHKLLAAWITPDAPAIQALLQRAGDYTDTWPMQTGYDGSANDETGTVLQRLEAVWGAISEYEISTSPLDGCLSDYSFLHVRTPYDVLAEGSANYIEKALLLASATEALGLETALIFTPEQAYAGIRMDKENALYYFVDTSLIGLSRLDQAIVQGEKAWGELKAHLDAEDEDYYWLDLETARSQGVLPMPFSQEKAGSSDTLVTAPPTSIGIHYIYNEGLITALYHLYGNVLDDFIKVHLTNNSEKTAALLVETGIEGYSTTASSTVIIGPNERLTVRQNPRLNIQAVDALNSRRPGNVFIRVTQLKEGEDEVLLSDSVEITIYSRRDFIWVNGFKPQEMFELYAAWVTPNDPAVEELIRHAADYAQSGIIFNGYGDALNDDKGTVWDRLQAIWRAEEDDDLTYISTMVAFSAGYNQRIRTPYDVLEQKSGNCIETTLLFASAAEALDLEAAIVQIPGHAYIGIRMDQENTNYYFIETTLIGRASFTEAVQSGLQKWEETLPHLQAGDPEYYWINVYEARDKGILPMPWR